MTDAQKEYTKRYKTIEKQIAKLQATLEKHERDFVNSGSNNWGYVGDLGRMIECLDEAIN